uniref:Uncharacterized protein n=1 Tax=Arabidopsis thaliana TaxID=3702 RepID=Q0WMQ2_ARATH|nr:hypothetical protein [Arabidopsis thaliana]
MPPASCNFSPTNVLEIAPPQPEHIHHPCWLHRTVVENLVTMVPICLQPPQIVVVADSRYFVPPRMLLLAFLCEVYISEILHKKWLRT